jgi:hypothetical protein
MANYLVVKRMLSGGVTSFPGEVFVRSSDDIEVPILLERGFIVPVPDNYQEASASSRETAPVPDQESGAASTSPDSHAFSVGNAPAKLDPEPSARAVPTDDQLIEALTGLSDEEIATALENAQVEVADDATREDKEAALLDFAHAHPELFAEEADTSGEDQGEGASEDEQLTAEQLEKKFSRDELDAQAVELGIEDAEKLPNKGAVAEAIVAARDAG